MSVLRSTGASRRGVFERLPNNRLKLVALALVAHLGCAVSAETQQTTRKARSRCPPAVERLVAGGAEFTLPQGCIATCQSGIDAFNGELTCGQDRIGYGSAFPASGPPPLDEGHPGLVGSESVRAGRLLWGIGDEKTRCAVLFVPMGPKRSDRFAHRFCALSPSVTYERLLAIARGYRVNRSDDVHRLCPYCG